MAEALDLQSFVPGFASRFECDGYSLLQSDSKIFNCKLDVDIV